MSPFEEGQNFMMRGDLDSAVKKFVEALNGDFFNDEILFYLGSCFQTMGWNGIAAVVTSAAIDGRIAHKRPSVDALINLGCCYKAEQKIDLARSIWEDALKQDTSPRNRAGILANIGSLYVNEGCPEKAVPFCDEALAVDPTSFHAKSTRGLACLELGRWKEGWEGWKATFYTGQRTKKLYRRPGETENIPEWDGSPDKTVIVWADQGLGDEIYYASCFNDMIRHSKRVILDCHPRLDKLFARSFPMAEVHGTRKDMTELPWLEGCDADAAICMAELPYFFRQNGEWNGKPYLTAEKAESRDKSYAQLGIRMADWPPRRIGISWAGGSKTTRSNYRCMALAQLEPVIRALPNAEWFSVQYTEHGPLDNAAREVCEFEEKTGIRIKHFPGWVECFDYDRTASFVASLDLVITVCTTVHHLAGALGVPVWTMVPSRMSWRYGVRGEALPWYGSARLFRQEQNGDWSGVIERIAGELAHNS